MNYKSKWEKNPWRPKTIVYEPTNERLTASAGLGPLIDTFMASPEFSEVKACLPERVGNSSYSAEHLAMISWEAKIPDITNWQPWVYTFEQIKKANELGKALPAIDVGFMMYEPGWAQGVQYPIVDLFSDLGNRVKQFGSDIEKVLKKTLDLRTRGYDFI